MGYPESNSNGFKDHYGTQQYIAPNGELVTVPLYKLVGDAFFDSVIDPLLWTTSAGTGGSVAASGGQLIMQTGTTANNVTSVSSAHIARFSGLAPNKCRIPLQCPDGGTINNTRQWGVATIADGAYFDFTGTTLSCYTIKGGVATLRASSGSATVPFNGQFGTSFTMGTSSHFFEIVYQPRQVIWLADNKIIHTLNAAASTWTDTLHLPLRFVNFNTGGSTTNVTMQVRLGAIARFGIPQTQTDGYYQQGLTAGVQLKYGPGNLLGFTASGVTNGAIITLYDGTSTAGKIIDSTGAMGPQTQPLPIPEYGEAFNDGLFLTITGASANAKVSFD